MTYKEYKEKMNIDDICQESYGVDAEELRYQPGGAEILVNISHRIAEKWIEYKIKCGELI